MKIAKEIGDRGGEGNAYHNIGKSLVSLDQFKNAADNFSCALKAFNAVISYLKSRDDSKINYRELHETTYTGVYGSRC